MHERSMPVTSPHYQVEAFSDPRYQVLYNPRMRDRPSGLGWLEQVPPHEEDPARRVLRRRTYESDVHFRTHSRWELWELVAYDAGFDPRSFGTSPEEAVDFLIDMLRRGHVPATNLFEAMQVNLVQATRAVSEGDLKCLENGREKNRLLHGASEECG